MNFRIEKVGVVNKKRVLGSVALLSAVLVTHSSNVLADPSSIGSNECRLTADLSPEAVCNDAVNVPGWPQSSLPTAVTKQNRGAVRSDHQNGNLSPLPIDAWGYCRYIDNNTHQSIFVPFNTEEEWTSFLNNPAPSGVTFTSCAGPQTFTIPSDFSTYPDGTANPYYDASHACDTAQQATAYVPYGRLHGAAVAQTFRFTCGSNNPWTQVATAVFSPSIGTTDNPGSENISTGGWTMQAVTYSTSSCRNITYFVSASFSGPDAVGVGLGNYLKKNGVALRYGNNWNAGVAFYSTPPHENDVQAPTNAGLGSLQSTADSLGSAGGDFTGNSLTLTVTQTSPLPGGSFSFTAPISGTADASSSSAAANFPVQTYTINNGDGSSVLYDFYSSSWRTWLPPSTNPSTLVEDDWYNGMWVYTQNCDPASDNAPMP